MSETLHDCRHVSSLSITPYDGGQRATIAAHDGRKPREGDYLALTHPKGGLALYRCVEVDLCMNVDPANMWIARAEFVPGRAAATLDLPEL